MRNLYLLLSISISVLFAEQTFAQTYSTASRTTGGTLKVFGGTDQYRTWVIGINAGVTSQALVTGGSSDFNGNLVRPGFGVLVRKSLSHVVGLQLDLNAGRVAGNAGDGVPGQIAGNGAAFVGDGVTGNRFVSYSTNFAQGSLSAVVNFGSIDFLHRENVINFYGKAGLGLVTYKPDIKGFGTNGTDGTWLQYRKQPDNKALTELVVPVGVGTRIKLSNVTALTLGYTVNFVDGDNFDGVRKSYPTKDRYSYASAGLEFTLGSKSKPSLEWANPVAMMYDELYDAALRQEVEALKGRVTNVEKAVSDLKKDTDGDGVADQFDKCPGTPAGTVVDGGGCPIVFPSAEAPVASAGLPSPPDNIIFQFDTHSKDLRADRRSMLDPFVQYLLATGRSVTLSGQTNWAEITEGERAANKHIDEQLSKERVKAVADYLTTHGVAQQQIISKYLGRQPRTKSLPSQTARYRSVIVMVTP